MEYMILCIFACIVCLVVREIIFVKGHKGPLEDGQIERLSRIRQIRYINENFNIDHTQIGVNVQYRSCLNKTGRWDKVSLPFNETMAFVTELLKYKRHEWYIMMLCDENECKYIWANKGNDSSSCYFNGDLDVLVALAQANKCNTVITMHNHPHTRDIYWNLLQPSDTDLNSYKRLKEIYNEAGLNYICGLCTQGKFMIYGQSFSALYFPENASVEKIAMENNKSEKDNLKLHRELRRYKRIKLKELK